MTGSLIRKVKYMTWTELDRLQSAGTRVKVVRKVPQETTGRLHIHGHGDRHITTSHPPSDLGGSRFCVIPGFNGEECSMVTAASIPGDTTIEVMEPEESASAKSLRESFVVVSTPKTEPINWETLSAILRERGLAGQSCIPTVVTSSGFRRVAV